MPSASYAVTTGGWRRSAIRQMKAGIPTSEVISQIATDMPARPSRSSASPQPGSSTVRGSIRHDAASSGDRTLCNVAASRSTVSQIAWLIASRR